MDGVLFPFANERVVDFIAPYQKSDGDKVNLDMYDAPASPGIYKNFLNWLYKSFNEDESEFKEKLIAHRGSRSGHKVLMTSVALGMIFL